MTQVIKLQSGEMPDGKRRLHLRDITNDVPADESRVGGALRGARQSRGEELQAAADALRIRRSYLEALEESNYSALPGRAYALGFVRSYAEHLGLDAGDIVAGYKAETAAQPGAEMSFPEITEETRLPKGSLLILGLLLAAGIYGGWLLSLSADRMVTERVPPVPERLGPATQMARPTAEAGAGPVTGAPAAVPPGQEDDTAHLPGDVAAAATNHNVPAREAMAPASQREPDRAVSGDIAVAALQPPAALMPTALESIPEGRVYGVPSGGRVVIRARAEDAWIRIEDRETNVLLEETLGVGDVYRAPDRDGLILVARDAGALEILLDGQSLGLAGPEGLVLTGKSLDISDLSGSR